MLWAWIGHLSEKSGQFEFLESFCCSISSVSIYYAPESDTWVKTNDHLNFSIASGVHFRVSRYIIHLIRTSEWKVMTIWISRELLLPNLKLLDILFAWIRHLSEIYDHLNFSRAIVAQFRASGYIIPLNRTSEWKVMTIWISRELPFFNFEHLDILFPGIWHPCEKLWPFKFLESFHCSMSSVLICYAPKSDIRVKSQDNLNF